MKKLLLLLTLCGIIVLAILCKPSDNPSEEFKPPVDGTIVKKDSEDFPKKKEREAWFELMHQSADDVNWREIEIENRKQQAQLKYQLRKENGYERSSSEIVAGGNLKGKWLERGSDNNAGNMITVNYLVEDDMLYGRSAGGTLWKGDRTGFNWEVINQDYRFSGDLIEARYLENGKLRIIANLDNKPVFSDDDGLTWTEGQGIVANWGSHMKDFVEIDNGDIFVLQKSSASANYNIYRSTDDGTSWEFIHSFFTSDQRNLNLVRVENSDKLMAIYQLNTDLSAVLLWNSEMDKFDLITSNSAVGFGGNDRANLNAIYSNDTLRMYVRNHENNFFISTDTARTWELISNLPTSPWAVGVYVSPSDPSKILYGEVNPYRSKTGGKFWGQVSVWWEYYDDIFTKLHADIMDIKEFKQADGTPFTVVCNHGGVSQSFDYGSTYENIGLFSLNISQYYSVATHPTEREWVFAGSQDQGFQRGKIQGDGQTSLEQVISGDYGHIVFSGQNDNMWTVYPWGSVSYYANPLIQGPTANWSIPYANNSAWIPPLVAHPDKSKNIIFMAGGSFDSADISRIIQLEVGESGEIFPVQLPFDFNQFGGDVTAIGINNFNYDEIYALTSNGRAFKSTDGGQSFEPKDFGNPGGHYLYGACIKPSKLDPNVIYISGSGYSNDGVYKSTDGGESYSPMGNGLPSTLVFCIAPNEDESLIYAATEAGPYVYVTAQDQWYDLSGVGTPNQTYWSVEYLEDSQTARFGTYGRGIWDFQYEKMVVGVEDEIALSNNRIRTYPNPFTDRIIIDSDYSDLTNVSINDQQGRLVKKFTNKKIKNLSLDLSDLNNGIYFVTIKMNNKSVTEKIVKN